MMDYLMHFAPLIIIFTGAFISFLIVVYYAVKTFATTQGLLAVEAEAAKMITITNEPRNEYTVVFKNGNIYKFGGVDIEILEDDDGNFGGFEVVHDESKDGVELSDEHKMKYNQQLRYVDDSEILYINQVTHY